MGKEFNRRIFIGLCTATVFETFQNTGPRALIVSADENGGASIVSHDSCARAASLTSSRGGAPHDVLSERTSNLYQRCLAQIPVLDKTNMNASLEKFQPHSLSEYLEFIEPEQIRISELVEPEQLFTDMDALMAVSAEEQLDDLRMYFPMYIAAQKKYQIPWCLLWVIHEQETRASRDEHPSRGGFRGAMQIAPGHMEDPWIQEAPDGWEMLDDLPQRYHPRNNSSIKDRFRTKDWEEILRSGSFINYQSRVRYDNCSEDSILQVVTYNYSATYYGRQRVKKYEELKQLFGY